MRGYRRLIPYALAQRGWLLVILLLTAVSSAAAALQPWPMKLLIDYALRDVEEPRAIATSLVAVGLTPSPLVLVVVAAGASLALFAATSLLSVALSLSWNLAGQRMVYHLAGDLFARLQRLSLTFHNRRGVGDALSRVTDDTWCIYSVADGVLMAPIQQVITLTTMACIGFALDPVLGALTLAVSPLLAVSSRFFGRRLKRRSKLGREAKSRLMTFVHETLGAIPLVQAFSTESRNTRRFADLADDAVAMSQRGNLVGSSFGMVNGLITTAGIATILFVGGMRVLSGAIPLGTLLVFLAYARQMQGAAGGLFRIFASLKTAEASIDRVMDVMDSDEAVREAPDARALPAPSAGHVRLEGISFGFAPDQPVLKDVTLEARPGEVVALVGRTGAGKSTLVSLIPRFYDPWQGRVLLDGVDVREWTLDSLRSQVSIVLQEPFLFPLTIAENIAYGRPGASRLEIVQAATAAQADAFIRRLPEGYETVLGEGGVNLSGGERQRIAIARALLKDAPVLILDEPTSALDSSTEASLLEALGRLMEGRTTFVIAHRPSTVRRADRMFLLEDGRLEDARAHEALLASGDQA